MVKSSLSKKIIIGTIIILSFLVACKKEEVSKEETVPEIKTIEFGKQDGKPITWQIVAENYRERILVSEYIIDAIPYDENDTPTEWQKSSLYDYLNSDFVNESFNKEEREKLISVNDEDDGVVTLLSLDNLIDLYGEIHYVTPNYYNNQDLFEANVAIIAKPNEKAKYNEIEIFDNEVYAGIMRHEKPDERYEFANGASPYWVLDRVDDSINVHYVMPTGYIGDMEQNREYIGVRPVIRIVR